MFAGVSPMIALSPPKASSLVRPAIFSMVVLTIILSGVRLTHWQLRKDTMAVVKPADDGGSRARRTRVTRAAVRAPGGGRRIVVAIALIRPTFPHRVLVRSSAPITGQEPGARTALRRKRALVVGGPGRLGAG